MRTVGVSDQIKKAFQEIDGLDTRIGGLDRDLRTAIEIRERLATLEARHKGSLYARAGIQDYWIVNLVDRVLEVYRDPGPDPSAAYGWRYRSTTTLAPPAVVVPLAFPASQMAVGDLLP